MTDVSSAGIRLLFTVNGARSGLATSLGPSTVLNARRRQAGRAKEIQREHRSIHSPKSEAMSSRTYINQPSEFICCMFVDYPLT